MNVFSSLFRLLRNMFSLIVNVPTQVCLFLCFVYIILFSVYQINCVLNTNNIVRIFNVIGFTVPASTWATMSQ